MIFSRLFRLPANREDFLQLIAWYVAAAGLFGVTFLVEPNTAIALLILFFCLYLLSWVADAKNRKIFRDIQADLRRNLSSSLGGVRGELRGVDEALRGVVGEQVEGVRGELRGVDEALRGVVGEQVEGVRGELRGVDEALRGVVGEQVEGVRGELRGVDEALRGVVGEQVEGVRGELRGVDEALRGVVGEQVEGVRGELRGVDEALRGVVGEQVEGVRGELRGVDEALRGVVGEQVEGVRGELRGVDEALRGVVGEQVEGVRGELRGVDEALRGVVGEELEKLSKRVQDWRKLDLAESYGVASSIAFLVSSIRPDNPLEFSRGWSATPELLAHIYHHIVTKKPKVVLDIGSGMSTLISGLAVEKSPETKVISWEHLPEYAEQTMELLKKFGVENHVDLQVRPLEPVDVEGTTYSWYAGPHSLGQKIDLLIVDGPPESLETRRATRPSLCCERSLQRRQLSC
jgi:phage-related protein